METYVLNPEYYLINDIKRILLLDENLKISFIHPLHAVILSYFDDENNSLESKIETISHNLEIDKKEIEYFIKKLINNGEEFSIYNNKNIISYFPKNVLIKKPRDYSSRGYSVKDFLIADNEYDNQSIRLYKPVSMTIVINTKCITDCVYCYADRKYKYNKEKLSTKRIIELIREAKKLKMLNVEITGGEFFLEKDYKEILNELLLNGFDPKISTKIPLTEYQVKELSSIGLKNIQLSIDSIDENILKTTLKVKNEYKSNILKSLSFYKKYNIDVKINIIISKYNCKFSLIDDLLSYLTKYDNIYEITIGYAGYSINSNGNYFTQIAPSYECLNDLYEKIRNKYKKLEKLLINEIESFSNNFRFSENKFFDKAVCSGNLFQFYLLPDGNTTLCEELYWHPKFILGNLSKQSIMEMWQGKKALDFYNIQQQEFKTDSACKTCKKFNTCHKEGAVCWKEVMEAYGKDKWYYPDPRCPKAPKVKTVKYLF